MEVIIFLSAPVPEMSPKEDVIVSRIRGISAVRRLSPSPGSCWGSISFTVNKERLGGDLCLRSVLPKTIPDRMIVGKPTMIPYNIVLPMSACNCQATAVGEG